MVDTANGDVMRWARSRIGSTIKDKYTIDDVIGAGGMAVVFRATHRNQAEFAIKMLLPELSFRKDLVSRFLREGYAANSVKHPGVVQVVDDDLAQDGAAFLVMELLHGTGVEALWKKHDNRVPVQTAVGIVDQLLEVLAAAHAKGIVHRDIKPANLFLTNEGVVKVLDFGIARVKDAMASSGQGTHTGMLLGTPAFMAPEQAKAQVHEIDAQTDLWAAGATLFTLIAGRFVHDGENAPQLLINSATTSARPMSSMVTHVPPAIAAVVDRALAFDKAARWPNADEMRTALRSAYQATYGTLPSRDALTSPATNAAPSQPAMLAPVQQTVPLVSTPQPDQAFVGGTTAQPISRPRAQDVSVSRSRAPLWIALAGAVVVVGSAGTWLALHHHTAPSAATSSPDPVVASVAPPIVKSAAPAPIETLSALPVVAVDSLPSAAPSATVHAAPAHSAAVHVAPQPTAKHAPMPKPGCDPNYTIDATGKKIFKEECL